MPSLHVLTEYLQSPYPIGNFNVKNAATYNQMCGLYQAYTPPDQYLKSCVGMQCH
jgi:hypothetical protein